MAVEGSGPTWGREEVQVLGGNTSLHSSDEHLRSTWGGGGEVGGANGKTQPTNRGRDGALHRISTPLLYRRSKGSGSARLRDNKRPNFYQGPLRTNAPLGNKTPNTVGHGERYC